MPVPEGSTSNGRRPPAVHAADLAFGQLMSELDHVPPATANLPRTSQRLAEVLTELTGTTGAAPLRAAAARSLDLFSDVVVEVATLFTELVDTTVRSTGGGGGTPLGSPVSLGGPPGGLARTTLWIHTTADASVPVSTLRLTDLTAHDGAVLSGRAGTFWAGAAPAAQPNSVAAELQVAIPDPFTPGLYHGHVLVAGVPDAALPVRLEVRP